MEKGKHVKLDLLKTVNQPADSGTWIIQSYVGEG
jgi:hypothetical protein